MREPSHRRIMTQVPATLQRLRRGRRPRVSGDYGAGATAPGLVRTTSLATCSFDYDGLGSIDTGKFEGKIGSAEVDAG